MAMKKGYKQTEAGIIPEDWEVLPFQSIVGRYIDFRGRTPRKLGMAWGNGDILALSANNVQMGYVDPKKEAYLGSDELYQKWMTQGDCDVGDVLLTMEAPLGNVAQIPDSSKYILSQRVILIKPKEGVQRDFLARYMRGTYFQTLLTSNSTGSTAQGIQRARLDELVVYLPPTLAEQEAIAGALSDADAWIDSLEQLIAKKRQIKQGAMQELLTGKRRLPGFSGKWETKRLGDLGSFYSGGTPNTSIPEYYGGDIPWITSSDCNAGCIRSVVGRLTPAGVANSATKWVVPGTVLMALYGATAGVVAISKIDATINQAVLAMKLDSQDSSFMFQKLSMMKDWIIQTYTQGGQPNLSGAIVKSIELELPAYDEQVAIAIVLSDMDIEIESLESKLAKAREVKQGMMQELLTGRIRLI